MLTGRQIREGRALLGLSHRELATRIGTLRPTTVKQAEADDPWPPVDAAHIKAIQRSLEALGVKFGPDGVRLQEPKT